MHLGVIFIMSQRVAVTVILVLSCLIAALVMDRLRSHGEELRALPSKTSRLAATTYESDLSMWSRAHAHHVHWHFPGVRELEPAIFGTVANPMGFEFGIGVPIYDRLDDGLGNWTTSAVTVADSNNGIHLMGPGEAKLHTVDRTPIDPPTYTSPTNDEVTFYCAFEDPWGRMITIRAGTPAPKGPYSPFFGGVGTNLLVHGQTGIGAKTMPRVFAYVVVYAIGEVRIDGILIPGNDQRLVHVMVTHGAYSDNNPPGLAGGTGPFLCNNNGVNPNDLEMHVSLPPTRMLPHPVANSPVLGMGQEFLHIMFEDIELEGSTINGVIVR